MLSVGMQILGVIRPQRCDIRITTLLITLLTKSLGPESRVAGILTVGFLKGLLYGVSIRV